ncbi:MAG: SPRY domain-containing protein [Alphaproteobacteria bacterium]
MTGFMLTGLIGFGAGGEALVVGDTFDPSNKDSQITLSDGNKTAEIASGVGSVLSVAGYSAGKFYVEFLCNATAASAQQRIGVAGSTFSVSGALGVSPSWAYRADGQKVSTTPSAYGDSWTAGDVIGVALDRDAGTVTFYKNGVSQGEAFSGISGTIHFAVGTGGINADFDITAKSSTNELTYPPPSGFTAGWPAA